MDVKTVERVLIDLEETQPQKLGEIIADVRKELEADHVLLHSMGQAVAESVSNQLRQQGQWVRRTAKQANLQLRRAVIRQELPVSEASMLAILDGLTAVIDAQGKWLEEAALELAPETEHPN